MKSNKQTPRNFIPEPFEYHEEVTLHIDDLSNLGYGVGRVDGWVIFVPFALPGETVVARVYRNHSSYSDADLVKVVEASEHRVEPKCNLFQKCGGCQYQHFAYSEQLKWKQNQVKELFSRIGGINHPVLDTVSTPQEYGYRSKLTPHYQKPRNKEIGGIGFLRHGRNREIVPVDTCPIASDAINKQLPESYEELRVKVKEGKVRRGGTLLFRDTLGGVLTNPKELAFDKVGSKTFQFLAGEFFQNNPFILQKMVDYVIEEATNGAQKFLIDAYCGVGLFSISASEAFEECLGIEISEAGVRFAQSNAKSNNVENCSYVLGTASEIFKDVHFDSNATTLVIDPPRKGCDDLFLNQAIEFSAQTIVYVACDPATQARDVSFLLKNGYDLKKVQPFDLFPQTRHIENVVTLKKTN